MRLIISSATVSTRTLFIIVLLILYILKLCATHMFLLLLYSLHGLVTILRLPQIWLTNFGIFPPKSTPTTFRRRTLADKQPLSDRSLNSISQGSPGKRSLPDRRICWSIMKSNNRLFVGVFLAVMLSKLSHGAEILDSMHEMLAEDSKFVSVL